MDSRVSGVCARVPQNGWTSLHWAAHKGQKAMIEALLARGANLEAVDKVCTAALRYRSPPACMHVRRRRSDVSELLRRVLARAAGWTHTSGSGNGRTPG